MAEGKERAQARLENLQTIEPLLSSLRVLSLSTMQMAMNRQQMLDEYAARFNDVADLVSRIIKRDEKVSPQGEPLNYQKKQQEQVLAVIGSTRGIVGQYNKNLSRITKEYRTRHPRENIRIIAFGKRIHPVLRQEGLSFLARESLSSGSVPDYDVAAELIRDWDQGFEEGTLTRVSILSYQRVGEMNNYKAKVTELLPGKAFKPTKAIDKEDAEEDEEEELWPVPIVEGDPELIFEKIESHITAIKFYRLILDSVAAENQFRFRLLEEAKENTSNLLEELSLEVQANRRKEITQQLQELLVGSGMLAQR